MPTIDIPDKICSHCGGIRWITKKQKYVRKNGSIGESIEMICNVIQNDYEKKYNAKNSDKRKLVYKKYHNKLKDDLEYKEKNKKRSKLWRASHPEKSKQSSVLFRLNNEIKIKKWKKEYNNKSTTELNDYYVKKLIKQDTILNSKDIPQKLIELKRKQLLLTRKSKQNG